MKSEAARALLNPQLWRTEAARRQRQLEELQRYCDAQQHEFDRLHALASDFYGRYIDELDVAWRTVEAQQAALVAALDVLARASGLTSPKPPPPRPTHCLPKLPEARSWPAPPLLSNAPTAPSLKELHRRAAMRLHPDRATNPEDKAKREVLMRDANLAYAEQDRATLEGLLIASGESWHKLSGVDAHAHWQWLERCEQIEQGRLRVIRAHLIQLQQHPLFRLAEAASRAQRTGLDAIAVMRARLDSQAKELSRQLYLAERLEARSPLAMQFLKTWSDRYGS